MHKFIKKLLKGEKVEWKKLGEVCELKRGKTITAKQVIAGDIPVISGSIKPTHLHNESNRFGETITIAGSGTAGFVSYWNKPIWVGDAFSVIPKENNLLTKYIYYFLNSNQDNIYKMRKGGIIQHVYPKDVAEIIIPIPTLPVQKEIIDILDQFCQLKTALKTALKTEKILREKQYAFYRDKLLGFGEGVPRKSIDEIFNISAGGDVPKNALSPVKTEEFNIPILSNGIKDNALYGWTNIPKITKPSLTVSARGTIGWTSYQEKPFYPIVRLLILTPKIQINLKYTYYFMQMIENDYIIPLGGIPQLTKAMVKDIKIPLPSLEEQQRIVNILEPLDKLTNDITEGLPREIKLREKQYQFYRDLLLDFTDNEY